jgi:hypothetical protein
VGVPPEGSDVVEGSSSVTTNGACWVVALVTGCSCPPSGKLGHRKSFLFALSEVSPRGSGHLANDARACGISNKLAHLSDVVVPWE